MEERKGKRKKGRKKERDEILKFQNMNVETF